MSTATRELNLFRLTWPILLEMLLFMMMSSADTMMLSAVSDNAVSAVGVSGQFIFIALLILEVVANGAAIVVAQYIGNGKVLEATKTSAVSITLNLCLGLLISAVFLLCGSTMLNVINLKGDILHFGETYLVIVGGGLFVQALINILSGIIRTYGFTKQSMYVSLGINILHIFGNYALIFGHFGLPELGVKGAALSTVLSRAVGLVIFFWMLYQIMEVRIHFRDYIRLSKERIRAILSIGLPSAFESITYHSCQTVFLYYITFLGAEALATRQYAMNISMYVYLFSVAIGTGTAIITGRLVGAGRKDEAYSRVWVSLKWGLSITIIVDMLAISFREQLLRLFTSDPEILRLGSQIILLSLLLETGRTFNLILINSLRAAGDAKFTVYMGFISMVGISLPLGYWLAFPLHLGLAGVWLAIAGDEWTRGVIMFFRWRSRAWESRCLVDHDDKQAIAVYGA